MKTIIFHDGATKEITREQEQAIIQDSCSTKKHIVIGGDLISFSSISRIVSTEDYYNQHPNKRPQYENYTFSEADEFNQLRERKMLEREKYVSPIKQAEKRKRPLEYMILGLKKFINNNKSTRKAEVLLAKMEEKLRIINLKNLNKNL